jgi:hypothetical protein
LSSKPFSLRYYRFSTVKCNDFPPYNKSYSGLYLVLWSRRKKLRVKTNGGSHVVNITEEEAVELVKECGYHRRDGEVEELNPHKT